mgnify:CR=1 FL=1
MKKKEREYWNAYVRALGTATNSMSSEISRAIVKKDAVDTGRMRNVSKVKINLNKETKQPDNIQVDSTFYYI